MNDLTPQVQEARQFFFNKQYTQAWETIAQAFETEPTNPSVQLEYATQLCFQQREDEAQTLWLQFRTQIDTTNLEQLLGTYWSCRRAMADKLGVSDTRGQEFLDQFIEAAGWQPTVAPIKLSAVMIVKNEAKHLDRALRSVQGKVDEVVVVDTGSTDDSVAIAKQYGATIGNFEWCHDFAKARNASLDLATGDWALWLDADEAVDEQSWNAIYEALTRRHFGGCFIKIVNFTDEDENTTYTHAPIRIFQLREDIRFVGRVHEQISQDIDALELPVARISGATIWHYGYKPSELESKQKVQRTISLLNEEIADNPGDAFHWFNLANTYSVAADHAQSVEAARRCVDLMEPGNSFGTVAFHTLASSLVALNRAEEALKACYEAKAKGYYSILTQFGIAHALFASKQFDEALVAIDACMEMNWPEDMTGDYGIVTHKSHVLKAQILTALNRAPKALELLELALSIDPNFGLAHYAMGVALNQLNRPVDAIAHLRQGFNDPGYRVPCWVTAAQIQSRIELTEEAMSWFAQAYAAKPGDDPIWKAWATAVENGGTPEAKIDCYRAFALHFLPDPAVWTNWGRALASLQRFDEAIAKLEEASRMPGADVNVGFNLADIRYELGQYVEAAEVLQAALQKAPENANAWFVLGNCFAQLGVWQGAKTSYEQTLRIDPTHTRAHHNLGMITGQVA